MKRILALFIAMAITAALWAGGTAVYAAMYVTNTPNITVALEGGEKIDGTTTPFAGTNWEPGYCLFRNIEIQANTQMQWQILFEGNTVDQGDDLADVIDVYWCHTSEVKNTPRTDAIRKMERAGTLAEFMKGTVELKKTEETGTTITVLLKMRESAGNEYQKLSTSFTMTVRVGAVTNTATNPTESTP